MKKLLCIALIIGSIGFGVAAEATTYCPNTPISPSCGSAGTNSSLCNSYQATSSTTGTPCVMKNGVCTSSGTSCTIKPVATGTEETP